MPEDLAIPQRGRVRTILGMNPSPATIQTYKNRLAATISTLNNGRENLGEPQRKGAIDRLQDDLAVAGATYGIPPSLLAKVIIVASRHSNSTNAMCYQASNICRILSEGPAGGIEEYDRILSEGLNHLSPNADASAMDANGFINSFWIAIYERYQQGPTAGIGSEQMILLFNSMDEGLFALGKADLFLFAREVRRIGEKVLVPILQRGIFFRDAVALYDHATRTGVELEQAVRSFEFLSGQDHVDIRALCQELANLKDQQSRLAIVETQIRALQTQAGEIRSSCDGIERRLGLKA